MNSLTDQQLLRDYTGRRSEAAFAEIVRRHVDLVYSAALRMVRDAHLAEDVTQGAFLALARQAHQLADRPVLSGWLHRTAQNLAANAVRSEVRRRAREQEAAAMNELLANESGAAWENIAPFLDAALGELSQADRDTVLLRFFEQKSGREMAQILDLSEEAAQKRVSRAIERLRQYFSKRNVTIGTAGLAALIAANAVQSAPAGLVAAISTAAATGGAAAGISTLTAAAKTIAMTTLQKAIIGAAFTAAIGTGIFQAHQAAKLRSQIQTLQQQRDDAEKRLASLPAKPVLHLTAPGEHVILQTNAPFANTNLYARLLKGHAVKLTAGQVAAYLKANRTNAASLLAAYRTSGDPALLQEAMDKFPGDPQVAFEALMDKAMTSEEQREWLNTFKQDAPNNALANYLSALNYFNSGQIDQGLQDLAGASGKSADDYTSSRIENDVEAFFSAGYPAGDAEELGCMQEGLPQLNQLKQLAQDCSGLANAYRQEGDTTSAQDVLQVADTMGQQYDNPSAPETAISQLVGCLLEKIALGAMDPNAPYGNNGQTVQDRLDQIAQESHEIHQVGNEVQPLFPLMSDQDWVVYQSRAMLSGEVSAWQWVLNKYGQQPRSP